jgi:hypothetical protein
VDIGGHPPVPNPNLLILTVFCSTCFSVTGTFLCNCGFCTFRVVIKPYTTSRWILVVSHLFQLAYFGSFHVSASLCTSLIHSQTIDKVILRNNAYLSKIPFQRYLKQRLYGEKLMY